MRDLDHLLADTQHAYRYRRYAAVRELWRYDDPRSLEALVAALDDPDHRIQLAAVEALGHIDDPRARDGLLKLWHSPDARVRARVITQLRHQSSVTGWLGVVTSALHDPSAAVREAALRTLATVEYRPNVEHLLDDPHREVRVAALVASPHPDWPEVVSALVQELSEPHSELTRWQPEEQRMAVLSNPALVPHLLDLLEHRDDRVILQAVAALAYHDSPELVEPLSRLLPWRFVPVAVRAGENLGRIGTSDAITALIWAAQSPYVSERLAATSGLIAAQHYPPLVSLANDQDMQVSQRAVSGLVYAGAPALSFLIDAIEAMSESQRHAAAPQIARYATSELVEALLVDTGDEWSYLVELLPQATVWRSMAEQRAREIDPLPLAVVELALRHPEPIVRQVGSLMVRRVIADPLAKIALWRMALQDTDALVRLQVLNALRDESPLRIIDIVLGRLADEDGEVRATAASILGRFDDSRAITPLMAALADPASTRAAALALGQLGAVEAVPALLKVMQHEDVVLRFAAVAALGQLRDARAVDALLYALHDPDTSVQKQAVRALSQIGDPRALPALVEALGDSRLAVRGMAAEALSWFADAATVPALIEALWDARSRNPQPDEHPNPVHAIIEALEVIGTAEAQAAIDDWQQQWATSPPHMMR